MRLLPALALSMGLLSSTWVQAVALNTPIAPTSFADTALPGTTVAARPELAGMVVADQLTPFNFSGVTGSVQSRVVRETGSGTLDFYWRVMVDSSSTGLGVSALRLDHLGASTLADADWRTDGLGEVGASTARVFNAANHPEGAINFLLGSGVMAGQSSNFFFLHTTATAYTASGAFDLLTTGPQNLSGLMSTFAPSPVPEPSTWALAVAGVLVGRLVTRRRPR